MSMSMDPDFEVKEMIAEARLKLRGAVGELTAEEVAAVDRKKRAWDFKMKVTMKLGIKEAISGLRLEVVFINDSPVAQFKCFDKVFYFRPLKGIWQLSVVDAGLETDVAYFEDDDPLLTSRVLVAIADHH